MLERLTIRDLALLEHASVVFGPGLNVITGETGAGKSLVVQAVDLLLGGRADADTVRDGAARAVLEAELTITGSATGRVAALLESWGLTFDGTLILRREIQPGGRGRAAVNESAVTTASLRRLGESLVDLHGQHEHQSLLRPGAAEETLDRLAGLGTEVRTCGEALAAWREAEADLARLTESLASFAERREWLEEAARELDEAQLRAGEDEALTIEAARLGHADRLRALVADALDQLAEGEGAAASRLGAAAHALEQAAALDPSLEETAPLLEEARIAISEAARALAAYAGGLDADPAALEEVEARRERIARLVRRYRRGVAELIAWRAEIATELAAGADADGALARARQRVDEAARVCRTSAQALSRKRQAAARTWSARVTRELTPLGFAAARLEFTVEPRAPEPDAFRSTGLDDVDLRFTANPGEAPRALGRIASGGELSRVTLALRTALEAQDPVDLVFFDEVDSGIGGAVAQAVGERLERLARHRQIICVTHLPMIAALARHHVRVHKRASGGRTVAELESLSASGRVDELARMLAGNRVTETTRRQARELLGAVRH